MSFGDTTIGYPNAANAHRCTGLLTFDFSTPLHEDNDPGATAFLPAQRTICSRNCQLPEGWSVASGGFLGGGIYLDYIDSCLRGQWSFAGCVTHGTAVVFVEVPIAENIDTHGDYDKLIIPAALKQAQWKHYRQHWKTYDAMKTGCFPHQAWDKFFQDTNVSIDYDLDPRFSVITWGEDVRDSGLTPRQQRFCRNNNMSYAEYSRTNQQPGQVRQVRAREGEFSFLLTCELERTNARHLKYSLQLKPYRKVHGAWRQENKGEEG